MSEGWIYSDAEQLIHGHTVHYGVDFAVPRGTEIYAAADGFAVASFHSSHAGTYDGRSVGFGLGNFVQVWHPQVGLFTCYGHLDEVHDRVTYVAPQRARNGLYSPEGILVRSTLLETPANVVHAGDLIGYGGDSGLSWGYEESPRATRDYDRLPSWDETHLHVEVYGRSEVTFAKEPRLDPFGIYGRASEYGFTRARPGSLWLSDASGTFRFAASTRSHNDRRDSGPADGSAV